MLVELGRAIAASSATRWLALAALLGLGLAVSLDGPASLQSVCGQLAIADILRLPELVGPEWTVLTPLLGWLGMVVAMMSALLAMPIAHVWHSSLRRRRPLAAGLFLFGYVGVWVALGILLVPAAVAIGLAAGSYGFALSLAVAVLWSSSPLAQAARNACHRMDRIAVFGRRADADCLSFGIRVATDCSVACWPWMLVPMLATDFHLPAMLAIALVLFVERLALARRPQWGLPPFLQVCVEVLGPKRFWAGRSSRAR